MKQKNIAALLFLCVAAGAWGSELASLTRYESCPNAAKALACEEHERFLGFVKSAAIEQRMEADVLKEGLHKAGGKQSSALPVFDPSPPLIFSNEIGKADSVWNPERSWIALDPSIASRWPREAVAFFIAHENAHIACGHTRKQFAWFLELEGVTGPAASAYPVLAERFAIAIGGKRSLNHSAEYEADKIAALYMLRVGLDPSAGLDQALEDSKSTNGHPSKAARAKRIDAIVSHSSELAPRALEAAIRECSARTIESYESEPRR